MKEYIAVNTTTSVILFRLDSMESDLGFQPLGANEILIENTWKITEKTHYWSGTSPVEKIDIPSTIDVTAIDADGVDVATITDLPDGCIATVNSESEQETEGAIVFGTDLAGVYQILLTHPLALDTTLEVTAA